MKIYEILEALKNTSSTNKKQEILKEQKDNELFKKVLYYTYNPYYQFYIKKYEKANSHSGELTLEKDYCKIFQALDDLRLRKITGNAARDMVSYLYQKFDKKDAEIFDKILQKDLKVGINVKLINKVFDNLIPITPYMGAITYDDKKVEKLLQEGEVWSQEKLDGMFCNLIVDLETGEIKTIARNGKELHLENAFKHNYFNPVYDKFVITGELLVKGFDRYKANGLLNSLKQIHQKQKEETLTDKDIKKFVKQYGKKPSEFYDKIYMVAWDIIPFDDWSKGECDLPYHQRYSNLIDCLYQADNILEIGVRVVTSKEQIMQHFKEVLQKGGEGLVIKSKHGKFVNKKPNWQIKVKMEFELDMRIKGFVKGTPGTKYDQYINRIIAETEDGGIKTEAAGMPEDMMKFVTENAKDLLGKIVTIKCSGLSWVDGKVDALLHPRVVEIREDKNKANTTEEAIEIERSIIK